MRTKPEDASSSAQAVERSESWGAAWFPGALAQCIDGIAFTTVGGAILVANAAWEALFAVAPGTWRGRFVRDLEPAALAESFERFLARALERGAHHGELERHSPDGERISISTTATLIREHEERISGVLWVTRDSTREARIAESLQALGKRFRAIVQSATDTIVVVNERREILLWNAAAERMFGHAEKGILGGPLSALFADRSLASVEAWIAPLLSGRGDAREGITVEAEARRGDGSEFPVEVSFSGFSSGRGRFASAIVRDISARRSAEDEIRRALIQARESDRLKSAFLANVSHEIRTPLNVLLGTVELFAEHCRSRGETSLEDAIGTMQRSSKRLVDTLGRTLDYSRLSSTDVVAKPERVRLADLIAAEVGEIAAAAEKKGIALTIDLGEEDVAVFADRYCLTRALANLLDNAVKFTERGAIRAGVRLLGDGGIAIEIEDSGVGIAPAFLERLCDPFTQEDSGDDRRYEGQGLGLAVTRRSAELCGATLEVESEKGRGSIFRVRFPASRAPQSSPHAALVIVDAEGDEATWRPRLDKLGPLRVVSRTEEALQLVNEASPGVSALLIDLEAESDALGFLRQLRRNPRGWHLPVVGWLRESRGSAVARALSAGCDHVFAPPFEWTTIAEHVSPRPR